MLFQPHPCRCASSAMLALLVTLAIPAGAQSTGNLVTEASSTTLRKATPVGACDPEWPVTAPVISPRRATKLMLQVNAKGAVIRTKLVQGSNSAPLDKATIDAALRCKFLPALKHGKPVASAVPFNFKWDEYVVVQQPPPLPLPAPVPLPAKVDFPSCAKPEWPKASLRNEETGIVTMEFLIGTDGAVKEKRIIKSSGFRDLDNSALEAIGKCTFRPATQAGAPIESRVPIQYVWTLE